MRHKFGYRKTRYLKTRKERLILFVNFVLTRKKPTLLREAMTASDLQFTGGFTMNSKKKSNWVKTIGL